MTPTIHVGRLAPKDQWDHNLLERLLTNDLYPTGLTFKWHEGVPPTTNTGCILIVPARYWWQHTESVSNQISRFHWVLAIRTSDEEDWFDVTKVTHANIKWWIQSPHMTVDYGDARLIPVGFPAHFNDLPEKPPDKFSPVFLSAQKTHARRVEAFHALRHSPGYVKPTEGFTAGLTQKDYAAHMLAAKVAPAPSGAVCPDSFRLCEALESHAIPIADDVSPTYDSIGFWRRLFPSAPFPILTNYSDLPGYVNDQLEDWPANANRIAAWWIAEKRQMAINLVEDLKALGAI